MLQVKFANRAKTILETDDNVIGLAVAGSWLTMEIDEFSDLDLILVTKMKITDNKVKMLEYAMRLGNLLSGFTGEHVGESRILICLYDNPLLHVDIKFLTLEEFKIRIETPIILLDTAEQLKSALDNSTPQFSYTDFQWIEDRFWIWVHYVLQKIGRGELTEAIDFLGFLRKVVLCPLLRIKNGKLPIGGVRKIEIQLSKQDFDSVKQTIPQYNKQAIFDCLENAIELYRLLRTRLFEREIKLQTKTEKRIIEYLNEIKLLMK